MAIDSCPAARPATGAVLFAGAQRRVVRWLRLPLTMMVCASLVLSGCATPGGADDPNDVCRPERVTLRSTGDFFAQDIIQGAAIGAVTGGLLGLAAGGNGRSALIGALAGGAIGAAGGYWAARQKQARDQASLYQSVYSDLERENATIDKTQLAFNRLVSCRQAEASRIRADYRAGRLTRDQANALLDGVRARYNSDLQLAAAISDHIQQRSADFSYASNEVSQGVGPQASSGGGGVRPIGRPARRQPGLAGQVQTASTTNVAKRDEFKRSVAQAQGGIGSLEGS